MRNQGTIGILLVVCATGAFAINVIVAPFIYASGSDPLTLVFTRSFIISLTLLVALRILKYPIKLPPKDLIPCFGIGILMTVQTLAFFTAISLIPVSIGTLIEYTYPFQVAIVARILYGEVLTFLRILLIIGALIGLMLVIEIVSPQNNLNSFGVILMVIASVLITAKIITTHNILKRIDSRRIALYLSITVAGLCAFAFLFSPLKPDWPETNQGWLLLFITPLSSMIGMLCMYSGLTRIGPARTAMLANFEPIWILLLAVSLLGESFTPLQSFGVILVLICIIWFQKSGKQ